MHKLVASPINNTIIIPKYNKCGNLGGRMDYFFLKGYEILHC
jgi:hypothetical protein